MVQGYIWLDHEMMKMTVACCEEKIRVGQKLIFPLFFNSQYFILLTNAYNVCIMYSHFMNVI